MRDALAAHSALSSSLSWASTTASLADGVPLPPLSRFLVIPRSVSPALRGSQHSSWSLEGESSAVPLLASEFGERNGEVSPNGRWLAYRSNESGTGEIYVRPFPNVDEGRWQISTDGGNQPLWSRDGRELFYRRGSELWTVPVETKEDFSQGSSELLFQGAGLFFRSSERTYDVSPNGERFLMIKESATMEESSQPDVVMVENWFEELKRLVPTD